MGCFAITANELSLVKLKKGEAGGMATMFPLISCNSSGRSTSQGPLVSTQ
jgi:hypothetical protein